MIVPCSQLRPYWIRERLCSDFTRGKEIQNYDRGIDGVSELDLHKLIMQYEAVTDVRVLSVSDGCRIEMMR